MERPFFFFFNDTATTEIYTLSLHDALPISLGEVVVLREEVVVVCAGAAVQHHRSEEHTSELQSRSDLVCRLLLEKKKTLDNARTERMTTLTDWSRVVSQHTAPQIKAGARRS